MVSLCGQLVNCIYVSRHPCVTDMKPWRKRYGLVAPWDHNGSAEKKSKTSKLIQVRFTLKFCLTTFFVNCLKKAHLKLKYQNCFLSICFYFEFYFKHNFLFSQYLKTYCLLSILRFPSWPDPLIHPALLWSLEYTEQRSRNR